MALSADVWNDVVRIVIAYSALIVAVIVLGAGLLWVRKRVLAGPEPKDESGEFFTLEELRQMRADETLSEAEFETMKAAVIDAMTGDGTRSSRGDLPLSPPVSMEPGRAEPDSDKNEDWDWVSPDFDLKNRPER